MIELGRRLLAAYAWLVSTLLLGAVYYLVLSPACVLARLLGWDPLDLAPAPRDSYWTPREDEETGCSERIY